MRAILPRMTSSLTPFVRTSVRLACVVLVSWLLACQSNGRRDRSAAASRGDDLESVAPYQADVEEGLGAAVAILIDTSGSMRQDAPGDTRSKYVVAQEALEAMLDATDGFIARRPDFPIKIGIYSFSSNVRTLLPIQAYNRGAIRDALDALPRPGGGTAIGEAMRTARPDLYRAGVFRKYLLVVTDGENTSGRSPDEVARDIFRKSEGAVQIYFVAFDTSPQKFAFLKEVGGDVLGANTGVELRTALDGVYQGKILAEAPAAAEREPVKR
jgi:Mg-chelatase subunit ChlD